MEKNIIALLDKESPKQIAKHINEGEFTYTELNDALVDSVKGVTNDDHAAISLFFKREKKVDDCLSYLDC